MITNLTHTSSFPDSSKSQIVLDHESVLAFVLEDPWFLTPPTSRVERARIIMPTATGIVDNYEPSPKVQMQKDNGFSQLVLDLKSALDRSPGANFSDIDPSPILTLMEDYRSEKTHWLKYAHGNKDRCFTRNLVDRGNGKWNLVSAISPTGRERVVVDRDSLSSSGAPAKQVRSMTMLVHIVL